MRAATPSRSSPPRRAAREAASVTEVVSPALRSCPDESKIENWAWVGVEGVVEGVAAHVVGRFEHRGERELPAGDGERWQELPQQLAGHRHRAGAADDGERVALLELRDDHVCREAGQDRAVLLEHRVGRVGARREPEPDEPEALNAVHHRHPEHGFAVVALVEHLVELERPSGQGAVDAHRAVAARPQGPHLDLVVVDEEQLGTQARWHEHLVQQFGDAIAGDEV